MSVVEGGEGFRRNMSTLSHFGTGDVELRFATDARWDQITAMIQQAYEEN